MKKLISVVLAAAALCAALPRAEAADAVTEKDVTAAMEQHSLVNNAEDYELYTEKLKDASEDAAYNKSEDVKKYPDPECAYMYYSIKSGDNGNYFAGEDAGGADIVSGLSDEYSADKHCYLYKDKLDPYRTGVVYIGEDNNEATPDINAYLSSNVEMELFFDAAELARIINKHDIGAPEDIRFVNNSVFETGNTVDYMLIYIKTGKGEYVITNVLYTDGVLTSYLLLDKGEFIECMRGNFSAVQNKAYEMLEVKKAPEFTDISNDGAVSLLARLGIISGYEDGSFKGEKSVTRAEAARMIALATASIYENMDSYLSEQYDDMNIFTDVPDSHWAKKYILYGYFARYISGAEKTGEKVYRTVTRKYIQNQFGISVPETVEKHIDIYNFCPDDVVTERQMAKMLVSAVDAYGDKMASAEGGWPDGYAAVAKRLGICENASDKPATRLTAAHMIKNALDAQVTNALKPDSSTKEKENGDRIALEQVFEKVIFYNIHNFGKRVKLSGTMTASRDTDSSLREKEVKFTVGQDTYCHTVSFKAGEELTLLTKYDDIKNFAGMDCDVYIELVSGNYVAVMAR